MAITDWPLTERPREKILKFGVSALSDAELLAIFLRTGCKGQTALDLARKILHEVKSLHTLFNLPPKQLMAVKGLGEAKYASLQAVLELGRRYLAEELPSTLNFTSTTHTKKYLISKLSGYSYEVFACLFLNSAHGLLGYEELFSGTLNFAPVYPRVIAQKALKYNAGALILAHNHPSGNSKPSQTDIKVTEDLSHILKFLDIRILDHLIVAGKDCCSFAELGISIS